MIWRLLALVSAVAMPAAAPAQSNVAPTPAQTIVLDLQGPRPTAMLTIGSAPAVPVVFDTGASGTVLDSALAVSVGLPNLGPALVGSPAGGKPVEGFRTKMTAGRLGDAQLDNLTAIVLPLTLSGVKGIVGPSAFSGRLVDIDLSKGIVRVSEKGPGAIPTAAPSPYSDGPRGLPGLSVDVAGIHYDGHIDTGSNGALLFPSRLAGQLPLDAPPRPIAKAKLPGGQVVDVLGARIQGTVRVGPLVLENPEVAFIDGLQRVNVGMKILRNLRIILDPAERRGWILS